jgi:hypothetical protein
MTAKELQARAARPCPWCGGVVQLQRPRDGAAVIDTMMITGERRLRLAPFLACSGCEWCSETGDDL